MFKKLKQNKKLIAAIIVAVVGGVVAGKSAEEKPAPQLVRDAGSTAVLRLPNSADSSQAICLAPSKAVYGELSDALKVPDAVTNQDLANRGVFCVGNGSKVEVVDTGFVMTEVRIVKGANGADKDKVGKTGWVSYEYVMEK